MHMNSTTNVMYFTMKLIYTHPLSFSNCWLVFRLFAIGICNPGTKCCLCTEHENTILCLLTQLFFTYVCNRRHCTAVFPCVKTLVYCLCLSKDISVLSLLENRKRVIFACIRMPYPPKKGHTLISIFFVLLW